MRFEHFSGAIGAVVTDGELSVLEKAASWRSNEYQQTGLEVHPLDKLLSNSTDCDITTTQLGSLDADIKAAAQRHAFYGRLIVLKEVQLWDLLDLLHDFGSSNGRYGGQSLSYVSLALTMTQLIEDQIVEKFREELDHLPEILESYNQDGS